MYVGGGGYAAFIPIIFWSIITGLLSYFLAEDKSRNKYIWLLIGLTPLLGILFFLWLVGASDLGVKERLDKLISSLEK